MLDVLMPVILLFYWIVIPFIVSQMRNDSNARTFFRFYFAKRKCATWFAYIILIIISSGALFYYFLFKTLEFAVLVAFYIIEPVCMFLFANKRCKNKRKGNK